MQRKIITLLLLACILLTACEKQAPAQEVSTHVATTQEELAYQQALVLLEQRNYEEAAAILAELGSYQRSQYLLSEIEMAKRYEEAMALLAKADYPQAFRALSEIGNYPDAQEQLQRFQVVELTIDNWQEYFEFLTDVKLIPNNNGEYEQAHFDYQIQIKDDVYSRIYDFSRNNVLVTVSYQQILREIYVDPQTGYYTIDALDEYQPVFPYLKPISFVGDQKKLNIVDDTSTHTMDGGEPCNLCWEYTNFTVKDIEGYLFLYE